MIGTAHRVTIHQAKRHFLDGGAVLVSEHGHRPTCPVTKFSTTHVGGLDDWNRLVEYVRQWRSRYPNQRFYIVEEA